MEKRQTTIRPAFAAALLAAAVPAFAGDAPVAVSATAVYAVDTRPQPRAVKTAAERDELASQWPVYRTSGDSVTLVAPDGAESGFSGTSLSLPSGGLWTLESPSHGTAAFTVRRSIDGSSGAGTTASPAVLSDGDELVDGSAGAGYTFRLGGADGLFAALRIPDGFRLEPAGEGLWRLAVSSDGSRYASAAAAYPADTRLPGPDRTTTRSEALPVAYSGDGWVLDASRASKLTFVAPNGSETDFDLSGDGAMAFQFNTPGEWTVRLERADGTVDASSITVAADVFVMVIR